MKGSQAGKQPINRKTDNNQENNHCFETTKGKTDNPEENRQLRGTSETQPTARFVKHTFAAYMSAARPSADGGLPIRPMVIPNIEG